MSEEDEEGRLLYQALYRTFRPGTFAEIVGQEPITTTLRHAVAAGHIVHAYLFCGPRGTGKTSAAKILSRAVNCLSPVEGDPCGACENCVKLAGETNMDIMEIDAASHNGVDEIRDLRDKVRFPPSVGKYRVYIIDEVHMLSTGAFNALLKTLEEPPAHAIFILATTEVHKLPATIISRCQRFDFKRIDVAGIVQRLRYIAEQEKAAVSDDALYAIARAAEGGMRDAISILDQCLSGGMQAIEADQVRQVLGAADPEQLFDMAEAILRGDIARSMRVIAGVVEQGRDIGTFLHDLTYHFRNLMLSRATKSAASLMDVTADTAERYVQQAQQASGRRLLRAIDILCDAEGEMRWASSPRIWAEAAIVRICLPESEENLDALVDRIEHLESRLSAWEEGGTAGASSGQAASVDKKSIGTPSAWAKTAQSGDKIEKRQSPKPPAAEASAERPDIWKAVGKAVKAKSLSVYMMFETGCFGGIEGERFIITLPESGAVYADVLGKEEHRQVLRAAVEQAVGRPLEVVCRLQAAQAAEPEGSALLDSAARLFGRENVVVYHQDAHK